MLIHFAFGSLKDKPEEQVTQFLEKILRPKKLKVSKCDEFYPVLPNAESGWVRLDPRDFEFSWQSRPIHPQRVQDLKPVTANDIAYLPVKVPMVCFIDIPFNKLKNSPHNSQYGKLGIAFTNAFRNARNVRPVIYYTENSLHTDPIIQEWNALQKKTNKNSSEEKKLCELGREITTFRKPMFLWENFHRPQSIVLNIVSDGEHIHHEFQTYDRYELNYDFTMEREHRMAFERDSHPEFINFERPDIFKIIAPNAQIKAMLETELKTIFEEPPEVVIFPG